LKHNTDYDTVIQLDPDPHSATLVKKEEVFCL